MDTCRASSGDQAGGRGRGLDRVSNIDFFLLFCREQEMGLRRSNGDSFRMKGGISLADRCQ